MESLILLDIMQHLKVDYTTIQHNIQPQISIKNNKAGAADKAAPVKFMLLSPTNSRRGR
jgi:hypothetical protein